MPQRTLKKLAAAPARSHVQSIPQGGSRRGPKTGSGERLGDRKGAARPVTRLAVTEPRQSGVPSVHGSSKVAFLGKPKRGAKTRDEGERETPGGDHDIDEARLLEEAHGENHGDVLHEVIPGLRRAPKPHDDNETEHEITESVAELDTVAEDEEEKGADEVERDAEEPSNFLGLYFKEMARLSVLRPEEEFESARKIEELEIRLWTLMLGYAPLTDYLLLSVERALENSMPEFKPLRKTALDHVKKPSRGTEEKLVQAAVKSAERLRAIDIDKANLELIVQEMKQVARGQSVGLERAEGITKAKQFRSHLREVSKVYLEIGRAKNDFVKANLRLVVSIARRFNHGRMPLSDLIQEGALADKGRAVRLPVHMIDAYHRVAKSKRELSAKLGRQPSTDELGEATGIAPAKIEKMRSYLLDQSFSLDRPVSDDDGRKFIDFIQDPNAETAPTDRLVEAAMSTEVRTLLDHLKPMEADILRQRFGLDTDKELTLKEIGEKYNLSRERIRQLQEQALQKMRRALQRKDLM